MQAGYSHSPSHVAVFLLALYTLGCASTPPPHPRALECAELCAQYIGAGDLTRAEVQCDLGLNFSPQFSNLWVNKGLIAIRRGQKEVAKEHFIKALRYNQEEAQAYNNLGVLYLQEQAFGKAHDNFQRALKVNPDYIEARHNLALAFKGLEQNEKAKKELRTVVAINPNLADPHHWLGVIALEEKAYDEAIDELQKAVSLSPAYAEAWRSLGTAYAEAGKFTEAKEAFTSCIEADPDNAQCRHSVAIMARKDALLQPSLKEAKQQASTDNTAASQLALAKTFRERGLKNDEERALRRCVKLDGRFAPCHYGLYEVYQEDRRDKEAQIACKNFLKFATVDEFPREVEKCEKYLSSNTY